MVGNYNPLTRRSVLQGCAALGTAAIIIPAMPRAARAQEPVRGGRLRVTIPYNPASLDPVTGRNLPDFNTLYALYDALIDFDPDTLELKPMLAKSWNFVDPLTFVLELEQGVEFHDGTPVDAEAVRFHIERCLNSERSNVKPDLTGVKAIEATSSHQVTIHLSTPNSGLPAALTNRVGCIVSPASVRAAENGNVDRRPVGAGPFRFVEWRDNDVIRVERNQNYWRNSEPLLDAIDFRIINELNTAARTVVAGEADLTVGIGAQQIAVARRSDDLVAGARPNMTVYTTAMNYSRGPLADVRVRQAMNYALNREELNRVLMLGLGEATCGSFPREFWAADPETVDYYPHDVEKARALLREAGHADGVEIETWSWPDQTSMQRQEVISAQLAQAGIRLKVSPVPPPQAMQAFSIERRGDMLIAPTGGLPDPTMFYERGFAANALRNAGKVDIDGFRPLMDECLATLDFEPRRAKLLEMHRFVVENALQMPQFMAASMWIATKRVQGFNYGILSTPKYQNVWLASDKA